MRQRLHEARRRESGFTLIELLIVIVILGVLAAVVILAVGAFNERGELAACKADVKAVEVAVEAYRANKGNYPDSLDELDDPPGNYLRTLPNEDSETGSYHIEYDSTTGAVRGLLHPSGEFCAGVSPTGGTAGPGGGEPGGGEPGGGEPGEEAPGQVTGLSVGSITQTSASVSWSAPGSGGQPTDYTIQWATNSSFSGASEATDNASPFPLSGLSPNTTYYVRVAANNGAGRGTWATTSFKTLAAPAVVPPGAPTNVRVEHSGDEDATVRWQPPSNDGGGAITKYTVQRWRRQGSSCNTVPSNPSSITSVDRPSSARSYEFTNLSEGRHCFRVQAHNSAGAGTWSSIVSIEIDD